MVKVCVCADAEPPTGKELTLPNKDFSRYPIVCARKLNSREPDAFLCTTTDPLELTPDARVSFKSVLIVSTVIPDGVRPGMNASGPVKEPLDDGSSTPMPMFSCSPLSKLIVLKHPYFIRDAFLFNYSTFFN
jgi:hypothetical protein